MNTTHTARSRTRHPYRDRHTPDLFASTPTGRAEPAAPPALQERLRVPVFSVRLVRERDHLTEQITSPADAARLCCELLDGLDREVFLVVALSTASRVIGAHVCHVGSLDASIACGREVFRFAVLTCAKSTIVAHNHPSGNLEPSRADVEVTQQLKAAGEALGIGLLDHVIVGFEGAYTSLAERGLL